MEIIIFIKNMKKGWMKMFKHRIVRELLEALYAIMVTFSIGRWAIHIAYLERGYESIGGEYCFILIAYYSILLRLENNTLFF